MKPRRPLDTDWRALLVVVIAVTIVVSSFVFGAYPTVAAESQNAAQVQPPQERLVYSTKFVCGIGGQRQIDPGDQSFELQPAVQPGLYATAINIHNFNDQEVELTVRAAAATVLPAGGSDPAEPGPVSMEITEELGPAQGIEFDCDDIGELFEDGQDQIDEPALFVKGFVEIETQSSVEVVGVYTVTEVGPRAGSRTSSIDIEHVEPHLLAEEDDVAN